MFRFIKWFVNSLLILMMFFVLYIASFDIFYLQKKISSALKLIDATNTSQAYPPSFSKLADNYYGKSQPFFVAHILDTNTPIRSSIKIYISGKLIDFHLTHTEQLKVIANKIYLGKNCYGFQAAAIRMFNKPFQSLNPEETAKLITLSKAPESFLDNPEAHLKATNKLLTNANF